jgi:Fe-Mn family superoxide dismutase
MFWKWMAPKAGGEPRGTVASAIEKGFGDFTKFRERLSNAGMTRFGSGWAWVIVTRDGKLDITSTANQDSPLMDGNTPILGVDVWEHAYYLKYQNRRADYLAAWWNVVNWAEVEQRYSAAASGR